MKSNILSLIVSFLLLASMPVSSSGPNGDHSSGSTVWLGSQDPKPQYDNGLVHPFIVQQAIELLLGTDPEAASSPLVKDEFGNDYENELADFWRDLANDRMGIRNGTILEDNILPVAVELGPTVYHFWRPWLSWDNGLFIDSNHIFYSALVRALAFREPDMEQPLDFRSFWDAAIEHYTASEKGKAYFYIGRILHLLSDMSVPAHTHNDTHLPAWAGVNDEKYEVYTKDHFFDWGNESTGLTNADIAAFEASLLTPPGWADYPSELTSDLKMKNILTRIFFTTARTASLFESDNSDGYNDGTEFWPGILKSDHQSEEPAWYINDGLDNELDLSDYRCQAIGSILIPQAIKSSGLALRTFVRYVDDKGPSTQVDAGGLTVFGYGETVTRDAPVALTFDSLDVGNYGLAGVDRVNYRVNSGAWQTVSDGVLHLTEAGTYRIEFYAIDKLGNIERTEEHALKSFTIVVESTQNNFVLSAPRVSPPSGLTSDTFTFRVNYYDPDGDIPSVSQLILDGQIYPTLLETGNSSNGVYKAGPLSLSSASHNFIFHFENNSDPAQDTVPVQGPEVADSREPSGRNVGVRSFLVDPYQVSPSGSITLSAVFDNYGSQVENIIVHWLLYNPSGTIIRDVAETFTGVAAVNGSTGIRSMVLSTTSTTGYWIAAARAELAVDDDASDNFRSAPFLVGTAANYSQYKCQDGTTSTTGLTITEGTGVYGFRVTTFWDSNHGAECDILKNGSVIASSVFLKNGDIETFDGGGYFVYVWGYNSGRSIATYHGRPHSSPFAYTPLQPRGPAGTRILWKSQPQSGIIRSGVSADIVNNTQVRSWYDDSSVSSNVLTREFEVPSSASPGSYKFWIIDRLQSSNDYYFRETDFIVDPVHDISLTDPLPPPGSTHTIGDVLAVSIAAAAANSYREQPTVSLQIAGPSSYLHIESLTPSFSASATLNFSAWDTTGLAHGDYTLTYLSELADDVNSGNDMATATIHLEPAPSPPAAPALQTCTAASSATVDLTWADNSSDETAFRIDVSTDGIQWASAGQTAQNAVTFHAAGLNPNTLYYFRIIALNAYGESVSNVLSARTAAAIVFTSISPNGGEHFERGRPLTIRWTWTGNIPQVNVILVKGTGTSAYLALGITNEGSFTWDIPANQEIAIDYTIRIEKTDEMPVWIGSAGEFSIVERTCALMIYSSLGGTTDPPPGMHLYTKNESAVLNPVPSIGYTFSHWTADVPSGQETAVPLAVLMDSDKIIVANFSQVTNGPNPTISGQAKTAAGEPIESVELVYGNPQQLDQAYIPVGTSLCPHLWPTLDRWQEFIPVTGRISRIDVSLSKENSPPENISVSIRDSIGQILWSRLINNANLPIPQGTNWVSIPIEPALTLNLAGVYKIYMTIPSEYSPPDRINWCGEINTDGHAYDAGGSDFRTDFDYYFRTYSGDNPVISDASGNYRIVVAYGWSGTVTPQLEGITFEPASRTYSGLASDQTNQDFEGTEASGTLELTSPNGGESWAAGATYEITWASTGNITSIKIEYSTDGGSAWAPIVESAPNSGTYSWTITGPISATCMVRISDVGSATISDTSAAVFSIIGAIPASERQALITFYQSTGGDGWTSNTGWKTPPLHSDGFAMPGTESGWYGVSLNIEGTTVIGLHLDSVGLTGFIPESIANLQNLEEIWLCHGVLSGQIPSTIGQLRNLARLYLYGNHLSGAIPSSLGNLSNLTVLYIHMNQLSGLIPAELGNLSKLVFLQLFMNNLSGPIPPELGHLTSLRVFDISGNRLSGSISSELTGLSNLGSNSTNLGYNALTATDPTLIAFLGSKDADWAATQTIPPTGITVTALSGSALRLSWVPIAYTGGIGAYHVYCSPTSMGPYTLAAQTSDKSASSVDVTGLDPGRTYYFVVQTHSEPHANNPNAIDSSFSAEASGTTLPFVVKEDFVGTWDGQGVYYRNSDTTNWVKLSSPASMLALGDIDGDGMDDLIGLWPTQGGIWVRYSISGFWSRLSSSAIHIATGDMNGDGRKDLVGTWDGQGVFYRNSITGGWTKLASPATMITTGDIDDDGTDDLIGIWPSQGGVWVKYSHNNAWARLSSTARDISVGDANGDGREDLIATWDGQGVYYRNSVNGTWVQMASEATQVTCGDLDADGRADIIGIWPAQGGVWVKYSHNNTWAFLSSTASDISAGVMRGTGGLSTASSAELAAPLGGPDRGPEAADWKLDRADRGPGGANFAPRKQKNLVPGEGVSPRPSRIPGPGEPGFRCTHEKNSVPGEKNAGEKIKK